MTNVYSVVMAQRV